MFATNPELADVWALGTCVQVKTCVMYLCIIKGIVLMLVSNVQPVAMSSAMFYIVCSFVMFVVDAEVMLEAYSSIGFSTA